jgi:hypothetical protein
MLAFLTIWILQQDFLCDLKLTHDINFQTVRNIIIWFDPKMANYTVDSEKEYGVNCWDITFERLWSHMDWFAFGHYWGWGMKALIIRHYGICWSVSIMWELTEVCIICSNYLVKFEILHPSIIYIIIMK